MLTRRHAFRHGHDELVVKVTLLDDVSRVLNRRKDRATLIGCTIPSNRDPSTLFYTSLTIRLVSLGLVGPYMIVCLDGYCNRRLQTRTDAGDGGTSSFAI